MSLWPDTRLARAGLAWSAAAPGVVLVPWLWPVVLASGVVLIALAAWDAILLRRLSLPQLRRIIPARTFCGRPATIAIEIVNDNLVPLVVGVVDDPPAELEEWRPAEAGGGAPDLGDVLVAARSKMALSYRVEPQRRGDWPFGPTVGLLRSPLGLWRRRLLAESSQVLRVYPDTTRYLRAEALQPQRVFAALGVRPARQRGTGMEFESLREFVAGDDPRRIDWAASARRGRPVTRLYEHERNHTVVVAVDASRLMASRIGRRTKLDYAVETALALAYAGLASADRVGMLVFDQGLRGFLVPRAQRQDFGQFIELLRVAQPRLVEADYRALVQRLQTQQRQRALIVILTDFVEAAPETLLAPLSVLARRHRVLLVAVRDHLYRALDLNGPAPADEPLGLYRRIVLNDLLLEREATLAHLRRAGLQTLDLVPEAMTAAVLNRYLALRYGEDR